MANLDNAKKAIRVQGRKAEINKIHKNKVSRLVKETKKLVGAGKKKEAEAKLAETTKAVDKATKRYLHKNKASRIKSRLAKKVSAL